MALRRTGFRHPGPLGAIAALTAAGLLVTAVPLGAQTVAALFEKAQARQEAVLGERRGERRRDSRGGAPVRRRRAALSVERLRRQRPVAGAADLLELAYKRFGHDRRSRQGAPVARLAAAGVPDESAATPDRRADDRARDAHSETCRAPYRDVSGRRAGRSGCGVGADRRGGRRDDARECGGRCAAGQRHGAKHCARPAPEGDRVTIELSQEVEFKSDRVQNPDRVFFDFPNSSAAASLAERAREINSPLIKSVRIGRPTSGVTRVVLELAGSPRYSAFPLYGPYRLVVDLEAATADAPAATPAPPVSAPHAPVAATERARVTPPPPPVPTVVPPPEPPAKPIESPAFTPPPLTASPGAPSITSKGDYSLARQLGLGVSRIVIDAGHGGHDPGAQANGVTESELVLDVALRLQKLLSERPGFDVVLTRRTDEFIPLEERTAIANREDADLFLSIHANAHRQSAVRGVETYFLNFATNPEAEAVAARENATSVQTMGTLPAIVKAIALNNKLAESRELATILQTSLVRKLRTHNRDMRDLGVKQAPFVVLIGAQMPSVLTEIAFITNKPEARCSSSRPTASRSRRRSATPS